MQSTLRNLPVRAIAPTSIIPVSVTGFAPPCAAASFTPCHNNNVRSFSTTNKRGIYQQTRIELKMGVGLRYRRPRAWDGSAREGDQAYDSSQIAQWRKEFDMPLMQHSLGTPSYSDEEIVLWRQSFDKIAGGGTGLINLSAFQKLMKSKYGDAVPDKELPSLVMKQWTKFDQDGNNFIDFGEYCRASFNFDMERLKSDCREGEGVAGKLFEKYEEDGYITENGIFSMMEERKFTCVTTSDMRKFLMFVDRDKDGMISKNDFENWIKAKEDF